MRGYATLCIALVLIVMKINEANTVNQYLIVINKLLFFIDLFFIFGVLTPLSTIFQLYHGDQF
jgi:predicted membrane protein